MPKQRNPEIEEGSENVYADLGLDGAQELFVRAQIGFHVFKILEARKLPQRAIANILDIPQPEVSHLMNGHYSRFTTDKLLDFLKRLDQTVSINIRPHQDGEPFQTVRYTRLVRRVVSRGGAKIVSSRKKFFEARRKKRTRAVAPVSAC
jgi:predicted XRE-type DNA-binding protein